MFSFDDKVSEDSGYINKEMLRLEYLKEDELSKEIAKYIQENNNLNMQRIRNSDWSDRHRLDGNITFDEIALYLLAIGEFSNEAKIAKLKESHQKTIKTKIAKYIKQFEKEYERQRIAELIESSEFKEFKINFRKNSNRIDGWNELDNFNEYINFIGTAKSDIDISQEELQDIKYIAYTLYKLECVGITPQTYNDKVKKYIEYIKKGSEDFGILVFEDIPFSNPTKLYILMDAKLTTLGFSNKQKTTFYRDFNIRESNPVQKLTKEKIHNDMIRDLGDKFRTLPKEDQSAAEYLHPEVELLFTLEDETESINYENHIFSKEYYSILKEYNLDQFPFESIDPYYHINTEYTLTENPWKIDGLNHNEKKYMLNDKVEYTESINCIEKLDQSTLAVLRYDHISLDYTKYKEREEILQQELEDDIAELCDDSHLLNP